MILFFTVSDKPDTTASGFQVERWLSWSKALDSKSNVGFKTHRGFESHSLRHNTAHCVCSGLYFLTWCLQEGETVDKMYADRETILAMARAGEFVPCSYLERLFEFC